MRGRGRGNGWPNLNRDVLMGGLLRTACALLAALLMLPLAGVLAARAAEAPPLKVALQPVLTRQTLQRPVFLTSVPDGSGDLVVVEQRGVIWRFGPNDSGASVYLDARDRVSTAGNEEGLLSIAFAPDFIHNRTFYVFYSDRQPRRTVVARYLAAAPGHRAPPTAEEVVLDVRQPYANHNGGQLAFGPDGMLYVGLGDGGSAGDPHHNGQNRATLLGSILRLDVSRQAGGHAYAIPLDNPFVSARDHSRHEIWAYGLRNPWRFSFDRKTGDLWAGDVGQNAVEEVDRIVRGGNYGWNVMEGTQCYDPAQGCRRGGLKLPISEYTHNQGVAVTGGYVYRGKAIPGLYGRYVFGDYGSGQIWSIPADAKQLTPPEPLLRTQLAISSFGEDAAGELYVLDHQGGHIYRLVPAP
ncbi:MAG TPA: PQQ-dependent sugar dehydrogenase [bacterium]|nr:PQQ-dependent sugar dehydrogenase [bacterium]